MPIHFTIDAAEDRIDTTVTGPLLDADPIDYLTEVLEHPDYRPGMSVLVVCRDVRLGRFSTEAIRQLAHFTRAAERHLGDCRIALVAAQPAIFGLARMYQMRRSPRYALEVFRDEAEARDWLAKPAPGGPA